MHHLGLSSHSKGEKVRATVKFAKFAVQQAARKQQEEASNMRKRVIDLARNEKMSAALVEVDALMRKENVAAGYEKLVLFLDCIKKAAALVDSSTATWPDELEEAVSTVSAAYESWGVCELKDTVAALKSRTRMLLHPTSRCRRNSYVNRQTEALLAPGQGPTPEEKISCLASITEDERTSANRRPLSGSSSFRHRETQAPCTPLSRSSSLAPPPPPPSHQSGNAQPYPLQHFESAPVLPGLPVVENGSHNRGHRRSEGGSYFPSLSGPLQFDNNTHHHHQHQQQQQQQQAGPSYRHGLGPSSSGRRIHEDYADSPYSEYEDCFPSEQLYQPCEDVPKPRSRVSSKSFDGVMPRYHAHAHAYAGCVDDDRTCTSLDFGPRPYMNSHAPTSFDFSTSTPTTPTTATTATSIDTGGAKAYTLREVTQMTSGWRETLGKGGFGMVYYGRLNGPRTRHVAVKRKTAVRPEESSQFENEVKTLSRCRHKHLVELVGYCFEAQEEILIYEYMSNGTVGDHLFPSQSVSLDRRVPLPQHLSWRMRLNILLGAAKGLSYLHHDASSGGAHIHRDVKAGNVLLDDRFEAKLADFGLCKYSTDESVETIVKGTLGYLDPEYFTDGTVSAKSDVYSFGVLILVAIAGREAIDRKVRKEELNLTQWAQPFLESNNVEAILDHRLLGTGYSPDSLSKVGKLALRCISFEGAKRPTMEVAVRILEVALQLEDGSEDTL